MKPEAPVTKTRILSPPELAYSPGQLAFDEPARFLLKRRVTPNYSIAGDCLRLHAFYVSQIPSPPQPQVAHRRATQPPANLASGQGSVYSVGRARQFG